VRLVRQLQKGWLVVIMARTELAVEAALFEDLAECDAQRPRSWIHFPARAVGRVALMHSLPLPFRTHWNGYRDEFCVGRNNGCEACARGRGFKGHYAWAVYDLTRKQHGGFDFPNGACRQIMELEYHAPTRCGLILQVRKEGGVANGRFIVESNGLMVNGSDFGDPCDIVSLVCETYKQDRSVFDEEFLGNLGYSGIAPAPPFSGAQQLARG
jgi:hypothetical protein